MAIYLFHPFFPTKIFISQKRQAPSSILIIARLALKQALDVSDDTPLTRYQLIGVPLYENRESHVHTHNCSVADQVLYYYRLFAQG